MLCVKANKVQLLTHYKKNAFGPRDNYQTNHWTKSPRKL